MEEPEAWLGADTWREIGAVLELAPVVGVAVSLSWATKALSNMLAQLCRGALLPPFIRLVIDGEDVRHPLFSKREWIAGRSYSAPDSVRVAALYFEKGATLVLQGAERLDSVTAGLTSAVGRAFNGTADLNFYLTPPGKSGLQRHYDPQDVLICQLEGEKTWHLWEPQAKLPHRTHYISNDDLGFADSPELTINLQPGNVLYLPRGWAHHATTVTGSVHATIGVTVRSLVDALPVAAMRLLDDERFRRSAKNISAEIIVDFIAALGREVKEISVGTQAASSQHNIDPDSALRTLELWRGE
jgi:hypothetical protein